MALLLCPHEIVSHLVIQRSDGSHSVVGRTKCSLACDFACVRCHLRRECKSALPSRGGQSGGSHPVRRYHCEIDTLGALAKIPGIDGGLKVVEWWTAIGLMVDSSGVDGGPADTVMSTTYTYLYIWWTCFSTCGGRLDENDLAVSH